MQILKQSTGTSIQVGPFIYANSGTTAITDLTVGEVSAAGGSANFCKLSYGAGVSVNVSPKDWAHCGNGYYMMEIAGASIATVGPARIHFTSATPDFLPAWEDLFIMHGTLYDIFTAGAFSGVSIGGVSNVAQFTPTAKAALGGVTVAGVSNADKVRNVTSGVTINEFTSQAKGTLGGVTVAGVSKVAGITQSGVSDFFDGEIDLSGASVFSLKESIRLQNAVLFGLSSGGGGTTNAFRDLADGKNRIDAVVDSSGNRTTVSWDGT
jgi:hypothetical protein